ncbi:MAG: Alpha-methylacyl-CoA racemase [Ilumatobacteraceae bacterium]|nr:Alpha-methylacyl-CoA racemase [Ilumatobacteraceae bacterium]
MTEPEAPRASTGPLSGLRVIELGGQGPGPYCGMILADYGCDVITVDRPSEAAKVDPAKTPTNLFMRGKRSIALDLKLSDDVALLLSLLDEADVFIDPFRPGVCERLGIGPDVVCPRNPRLIYGRMTGFGQEGPLASVAGHDIDYIAMSGALWLLGREGDKPVPPINLLGDFAGGGLMLALGIAAAAFERTVSGLGQVIDAAMVDGAAMVAAPFFAATGGGWGPRGTNHIDTGAHFYEVYECADGDYIALGAIEPQFYAELLARLELDPAAFPQWDREQWRAFKDTFAAIFITRSRTEWCALLEGTEACFSPVLSPAEAAQHPHNVQRGTFVKINGVTLPAPAPKFGRSVATAGTPTHIGAATEAARSGTLWR